MSLPEELRLAALEYHRLPRPGKIKVTPTTSLLTQRDLSLAYSPGVAAACDAIVEDPTTAAEYTARSNLVAVITNGTAVLGLGNIGPLAAKPVMEGKGVLFQKFAGIDVFDIEIDENDPDKLVDIIASLEPTFGGINLEDIKAPECFIVERKLRERMKIPVFHDDQHGTSIIVGAALLNALIVVGKKIEDIRVATTGAGAAGISCLDMLVALGVKPEHILAFDRHGVLHSERTDLDPDKQRYARDTKARTLAEIVEGADVFLGLSAGGILKPEMVAAMARAADHLRAGQSESGDHAGRGQGGAAGLHHGHRPFGLSEPGQQRAVLPVPVPRRAGRGRHGDQRADEDRLRARRSRRWRGASRPTSARAPTAASRRVSAPNYLIPQPFDPRLLLQLPPAVARAAMDSGVATRPMADFAAYNDRLTSFVFRTGLLMKPVFERAKSDPERDGLRRGRGGNRAARGAGGGRRRPGQTHPDRPPGSDREAHQARRPAHPAGRGFRDLQHQFRSALRRLLAALSPR